jgi:hypothetical protein
MKTVCGVLGVLWLGGFLGGQQLWVNAMTSPIASNSAEITARPVTGSRVVTDAPSVENNDSSAGATDILGNEIESALADYRIDRGGEVYERHSPETAVPRLGSPTS